MWKVSETTGDGQALLERWQMLDLNCLTPSHNQPEMLVPLLSSLSGGRAAIVEKNEQIKFALPLMDCASWRGIRSNWITPLCFMGTPLLDRHEGEEAFKQFLGMQKKPLLLQSVATTGPLWQILTSAEHHTYELKRWQRAALMLEGNFSDWLNKNFNRKRRKEYTRLENRLSEQGHFEKRSYLTPEPVLPWVNDFLKLESLSWKGQRKTDLAHDPQLGQAAHQACENLSAAGKLRFWSLSVDGKVIASLFAMVDGDQAWLGKIAFDSQFARYSPGVLLILYATQQLLAEKTISCVDSCAIPNHPMIDNIWRDRLEVADILIAPLSMSHQQFALKANIEKTRRLIRSIGREAYFKLKKGKNRS